MTFSTRIRVALFALLLATPAWSGANNAFIVASVPTLDEIGLGALVALIAAAAGWAVRRRNKR